MSVTSITEALCANCGQTKPADRFSPNVNMRSGLDSWCDDCRVDYARKRYNRGRTTNNGRRSAALARGDPVEFSRAVCEHVTWYVQRKITEFETLSHKEAPPHLTAILSVAKSITAQHPAKQRPGRAENGLYKVRCVRCSERHLARSPITKYCDKCRPIVRKEKKREWNKTPAGRMTKLLGDRKRRAQPREIQCAGCGDTITVQGGKRRYCDTCRHEAQVERGRQQQRRQEAKPPSVIQCQRCGTSVTVAKIGRRRKYCLACAGRVNQERKNELKRRQRAAYRELHPTLPHRQQHTPPLVLPHQQAEAETCQECGSSFLPVREWQLYCSSRCRARAHRAKVQ